MNQDQIKRRRLLRTMLLIVDVFAAASVSANLIAGTGVVRALAWGFGAAALAALGLQALRATASALGPGREPYYCEWLNEREKNDRDGEDWTDRLPDPPDGPWTLTGVVLTVIGLPLVAVYVLVRILLLNLVSVVIILAVWAFHPSVGAGWVGLAIVVAFAIALISQGVALLPLAKRWGVRL